MYFYNNVAELRHFRGAGHPTHPAPSPNFNSFAVVSLASRAQAFDFA
jgi:hypothetical protein